MAEADRMLTIQQVCKEACVSRSTVYAWMAKGRLRWKRTVGGQVRVYADSLWLPDGAEKPMRDAATAVATAEAALPRVPRE